MTVEDFAVTDDGLEIAFDDRGRGPAVIWLHGITDDRTFWTPITSRLADQMRCIRIDFRGHGSSASRGPYATGFILDLAAVIRATGVRAPVVVGHSLGGVVATIAAAAGMTGAVVCVDQPLKLATFAKQIRAHAARLRDPRTYADTIIEEKLALGMGLVPAALLPDLESRTRNSNQEVVLDVWRPILDDDFAEVAATERTLAEALRSIAVPYLALHSTPVEEGYEDWFRTTNPAATFEYWPQLGHWIYLVEPDRFVERIQRFMAANPTSSLH
jgi:pimeloyl-ACP methyl ester carboxylesterase